MIYMEPVYPALDLFTAYAGYINSTMRGREKHGLEPFGGTAMWSICLWWNLAVVGYYLLAQEGRTR